MEEIVFGDKLKKILFFIRSLNAGGAERQLVVTAKGLAGRGHNVTVLTFYAGGFYADELQGTPVKLLNLNKTGRWDMVGFLWRLGRVLRQEQPDVIYSFMNTANILAVVMRPWLKNSRLVWGVRASNMDLSQYDWLSRRSYWFECRLSRFADLIIANSCAGKEYAVVHGFPENKITVIHNGIDTKRFYPDKSAGKRLRDKWGVTANHFLIGAVGRIDPMKGIPTFLHAAKIIKEKFPNARFVWVGTGDATYEQTMRKLATELGLDDIIAWAGRHTDMVAVYNAFDIASSSSYGEGFPNVLGEAMACGVPCVVTDVGDSSFLVGDAGVVVPAKDSVALAVAWNKMLSLGSGEFRRLSDDVLKRVVDKFGVRVLLNSTERVLVNLSGDGCMKC